MVQDRLSPPVLLVFFAIAIFLTMTVALMLGPILVALANEFHTSLAVTGQLAAATAMTWGLTAFLAGPVSDTYGRRLMLLLGLMLMTLGTLSAALAPNYGVLLAARCQRTWRRIWYSHGGSPDRCRGLAVALLCAWHVAPELMGPLVGVVPAQPERPALALCGAPASRRRQEGVLVCADVELSASHGLHGDVQ